mgnify:CR=1 FL=1
MATKATLTLTSPDLVSDNINFSVEATLTQAGGSTDIAASTGLARTNFVADPVQSKVIFRSEDATADGANKIYMKNTSSTATEFFTIFIDQEEMGRLYAGDWAFFPWIASQGTKETFIVTSAGTVAAGDSWDFDGITTTSADANSNNFAAAVHAQNYPNWTTTISTAAVTFTAREAGAAGVVTGTTAITGDTITDLAGSDLTMAITSGTVGTRSEADIHVVPSVATTMVLEHMLFKQ